MNERSAHRVSGLSVVSSLPLAETAEFVTSFPVFPVAASVASAGRGNAFNAVKQKQPAKALNALAGCSISASQLIASLECAERPTIRLAVQIHPDV